MPWQPISWEAPLDPRLDRYRNRAAALTRNGDVVGHVLFLTNLWAVQIGGHLWRRRWAPAQELPQPVVRMQDGTEYDGPMDSQEVEEQLPLWSGDQFALLGETLTLMWLSTEEARQKVPSIFGVTWCLDVNDEVIWSYPTVE